MTGEMSLQVIAVIKLITAALFAGLYGLGGMHYKWLRRFLAPILLGGAMVLFAGFHWAIPLYVGLLIGALHLGYGGDSFAVKLQRRLVYGAALSFTILALTIVNQAWLLVALHTILCCFTTVILGVWNPLVARDEESLIGFISVITPLFLI